MTGVSGDGEVAAVQTKVWPKPQKMGGHGSLEFLPRRGEEGEVRGRDSCAHMCTHVRKREKASKFVRRPGDVGAPASMGGSRQGPAVPRDPLVAQREAGVGGGHLWAEP